VQSAVKPNLRLDVLPKPALCTQLQFIADCCLPSRSLNESRPEWPFSCSSISQGATWGCSCLRTFQESSSRPRLETFCELISGGCSSSKADMPFLPENETCRIVFSRNKGLANLCCRQGAATLGDLLLGSPTPPTLPYQPACRRSHPVRSGPP